jgi:tRNA pseudouridine38-40 synthase
LPNYLLTIAYDGTGYAGWQCQAGRHTVQQRLEEAVERIAGESVRVHGAGRTDAGVHALRQCAHLHIERSFDPEVLRRAVNAMLPEDIVVRAARVVADGFHARFSARGKRYVYRSIVSRIRPVIARHYFHWIRTSVDLTAIRRAAAVLVGRHDFAAFASNPGYPRRRGTVRHVQRLRVVRRSHGFDLVVQADGFLYNMVRTIAGTLILVGKGARTPESMVDLLASRDRRRAGPNAPACGLYLQRVLYNPEAFSTPVRQHWTPYHSSSPPKLRSDSGR